MVPFLRSKSDVKGVLWEGGLDLDCDSDQDRSYSCSLPRSVNMHLVIALDDRKGKKPVSK